MTDKPAIKDYNYINMDEQELVDFCKQGKLNAFNELISRYENRVLSQTIRYLHDYQTALDEAQEVFIKVFKKINSFNGDSSFGTWLYRVTANHCLNVIGRRKRQQQNYHVSYEESQNIAGDIYTEDKKNKLPDEVIASEQIENEMKEAIAKLAPDQQKVIVMRHYEEMCYEDIAELMEVPVTTVCSCLYRARQQLRKIINRKGGLRK